MARIVTSALSISVLVLLAANALAASQDRFLEFRNEFDKALKVNSASKMDSLMKSNQEEAVHWIENHAELLSKAPNDVLFERFDGLRSSWNRVYETEFPDIMERYFAYADSKSKDERYRLKNKYRKVNKSQVDAQAEKDTSKLSLVADEYTELAKAFATIGDKYMESRCYFGVATTLEVANFGEKRADLRRVAQSYSRAIALADEVELKDRLYKQSAPRLKSLEAKGYSGGGGADGAGGDEIPVAGPESRGPAVTVDMAYEALEDMQDSDRPSYYLDQHNQVWPPIRLTNVGSSAGFDRMEGSPRVFREGASKAMIDTDGDGQGDTQWPTRGRLEVFELELGSGATKRPWAVLTDIGRQRDFYQGQQMNLEPTGGSWLLYYVPAGSMVGEIGGETITVVDDNLDGIYGSDPVRLANVGLTPDTFDFEPDSIRVGRAKLAMPWSQYANLGKAGWYRLESLNAGTQINAQPVSFKTGTVKLKTKGIKPDYFVLKGIETEMVNTYINVAGGKKVELPTGRWEFAWGLVRDGKRMQMTKAVMLPTPAMGIYEVLDGGETEIEVGAPFSFDFEYERTSKGVRVDGPSIRVTGKSGAAYERIYLAVPEPEVMIRKKGSKRASDSQVIRPALSQDEIMNHGWAATWKPLTREIPTNIDEVEVQLVEDKNKLFGKIESPWK